MPNTHSEARNGLSGRTREKTAYKNTSHDSAAMKDDIFNIENYSLTCVLAKTWCEEITDEHCTGRRSRPRTSGALSLLNTHARTQARKHASTHTSTHAHKHARTQASTHARTHTSTHAHKHARPHTHKSVHICVWTHTDT